MAELGAGRLARRIGILTAAWTIPVILGSAGHFFGAMVETEPQMPAYHIFGHSFGMWYVWIPATPVIFWLHRRYPISARTWPILALSHAAVLITVFLMQCWATLFLGHVTGHIPHHLGWWRHVTDLVVNLLAYDILIYGGVLAVAYGIEYAQRYHERDLRASQLEAQLARAKLESLQTQLQPHFLFNALNAVSMLVRRGKNQEAVNAIAGFGGLLRYVLDESGTLDVSLKEELTFIRRYLEIEGIRLGERLSAEIVVEPGVERALVPNLLLQPLVENALKHAIVPRASGGKVRLHARREGDALVIEVADDGPGLPPEFNIESAAGVGLHNLRERIAVFFREEGKFSLSESPDGGVLARIEIPYREDAREVMPVAAVG
jgi:two-component system, LytTR family, sensor kinase